MVDKNKLRKIIDGSTNSLDEILLRANLQRVFDITAMNKEMVWKIVQLDDLFKYVVCRIMCLPYLLVFLPVMKNFGEIQ